MKKLFFFSCMIAIGAKAMAQDGDFKYSRNGVFYKTIRQGTKPIPYGSYIDYTLEQFYNDSVLADTKSNHMVMSLDTTMAPAAYVLPMVGLSEGDSIVYKASVDSNMQMYAGLNWIKPGNFFITNLKIEKVFSSKAEADAAIMVYQKEAERLDSIKSAAFIAFDAKKIEQYLASKGIQAQRTPRGVYYVVTKKGTGPLPTDNSTVSVNYTGKTLAGKVFDSNVDPAFQHVMPYDVNFAQPNVIMGWIEGLKVFNKGAKGMLFIPSPLAYGQRSMGPDIGPNEILIFDIEMVNVKSNGAAPKPAVKTPVKPAAKPAVKPVTKPKTTTKH